ncbi:MAG TPA: TlpA disulfide reductase family protein [Bryobacteraceae bacterium]|nr:TlpA disulfide reductase family protein [Bryobacteraceae bacterium]
MFGRHSKSKALIAAGAKAPEFRLAAMDGAARTLDEILSRGPALLAFFKISCPVCQMTAPYLERLAANSAIQVIGISQDDADATRGFAKRFGLTLPLLLDSSDENYPASNAYGITSVPTMFLVEPDGNVSCSFPGFSKRDFEQIAARANVAVFAAGDHVPEWKAG